MKTYIYKLRARPVKERQKILYASTFILTGLIVVFWVALLGFKSHPSESAAKNDSFAPVQSLISNFSGIWESSKHYSSNLKEQMTGSAVVAEPQTLNIMQEENTILDESFNENIQAQESSSSNAVLLTPEVESNPENQPPSTTE